jgi:hypothetical protein
MEKKIRSIGKHFLRKDTIQFLFNIRQNTWN